MFGGIRVVIPAIADRMHFFISKKMLIVKAGFLTTPFVFVRVQRI